MTDEVGGHWYDRTGKLILEQPYADKKRRDAGYTRPTTLRDARKLGLLPSVTTILSLLDKPGLRNWKIDWAIELALRDSLRSPEEIKLMAQEQVDWAAAQGTKVHLGISEHFAGHPIEIEPEIDIITNRFFVWYRDSGLHITKSEMPVVSPLGYAGTVDYIGTWDHPERGRRPVIADFKTQDFEEEAKALFYDEHALQLSGYAMAAGCEDHDRLSIIISRQVPGLVAMHDWTKDKDRWDSAFCNLWATWQDLKNYYPLRVIDPDAPLC